MQGCKSPPRGAPHAQRLVQYGLLLALVCALALLLAGPAYRLGWLPLALAIKAVCAASLLAMLAAVTQSLALFQLHGKGFQERQLLALLGLCLAIAVALPPLVLYVRMQSLPYIHDISTDTENPPALSVLAGPDFANASTPYPAEVARLQRQAGYSGRP